MLRGRIFSNVVRGCLAAGAAAAVSSCAELGQDTTVNDGSVVSYDPIRDQGLEELGAPLTPLATDCAFAQVATVWTATVVLANDETAIISKRSADSAILVNGKACTTGANTATSLTLKKLVITGSAGDNTVILDYMNGTFAPGYGTATVGTTIDFGVVGGTDALKIRGSSSADTVTVGVAAAGVDSLAFNTDTVKDITATNCDSITVSLGAGNDVFSGGGGYGATGVYATALTVYGGVGNDTLSGGSAADTISGGEGNDTLRGAVDAALDVAADTLNGDEGDDTFDCGNVTNGGDTMNGGLGTDTVSYATRAIAVAVILDGVAGALDGQASETDAIANDVENVTGGTGNDSITGDTAANVLSGGLGDDTLVGDDGDDTLNGDAGDDTLDAGGDAEVGDDIFNGGAGIDTVDYSACTVAIDLVIDADGTADDGKGTPEIDNVKADVENIIGGAGNDSLTGSASDNILTGGDGDDELFGLAGADTFDEEGADSGSDTFNGGSGIDTIDYSARTVDLLITMDGVAADDGESGELDDVKTDVEGITGGTGDDDITGNDAANVIDGADGADTLHGGDGDDVLYGGALDVGVDILYGEAGDDTLDGGPGTEVTLDCGAGQGDMIILDAGTETATDCELSP